MTLRRPCGRGYGPILKFFLAEMSLGLKTCRVMVYFPQFRCASVPGLGAFLVPAALKLIGVLALDATIRAAAPFQMVREKGNLALAISEPDWRYKVREKRIGRHILFVVDASGRVTAVTLENGAMAGGFGSAVQEALGDMGRANPVVRCGWPDVFVGQGTTAGLMAAHGLTAEAVAAKALAAWADGGGAN